MKDSSGGLGRVQEDPIIGLDIGGHRPLFYCHVSTLTIGSPYFASRFSNKQEDSNSNSSIFMQPGDFLGKDEFGRQIYFVDRNGALFHYVLEYLRNCTVNLPKFQQNPELWRSLRREAAFFGLDGLSSMLQVTFSCSPSLGVPCGDRGILYWLGTDRGRSETYQNPYMNGVVNVGGLLDTDPDNYDQPIEPDCLLYGPCTWGTYAKANFVQHRHKAKARGAYPAVGVTGLDWCDDSYAVNAAMFVDLRDIRVRPTHYSMRYADCDGMTSDWVFAGSINGEQWDALHEAKSDSYIKAPTEEEIIAVKKKLGVRTDRYTGNQVLSEDQRAFLTDWVEEHFRRTWKVLDSTNSKGFYRFFRIQKVGNEGCLHGTSLEIFGDANECPED